MNRLTQTKDGSYTLYSKKFDEHYHSLHGALAESNHVFIKNGLTTFKNQKTLSILELGFGTGLNTLLTYQNTLDQTIFYHSIDAYPLLKPSFNLYLNTLAKIDKPIYEKIINTPWNNAYNITDSFTLLKETTLFQEMSLKQPYSLVYMDAFSPRKQPECWSQDIFENLFNHMYPAGMLVTYCSKGSIKRLLKSIGFLVETLAGPPGKREMNR